MKKVLSIVLALCMVFSFAACGKKADPQPQEQPKPEEKKFTVGVCQLVAHPALDAATQGFQDALKEALGDKVTFDVQVASGDLSTCTTVVNTLLSKKVDLIMANATPALQAAAEATKDVPILGTSVTEYGVALDIANFTGVVGRNISGTSDLAPLDKQAAMIKEWFPAVKTVGLLYCSAEANSKYQVVTVAAELKKLGIESKEYAFADSNDLSAVTAKACSEVDVIYVPTDNTCADNAETIRNVVEPAKIPVIAGEEGICKGCGVATLSISYYDLGVATGKMAAKILADGADITKMPIDYAATQTQKYNKELCAAYGLTAPAGYVAIE